MPEYFHGKQRKELCAALRGNWLFSDPRVAVIVGFPGSGKTEMAREVGNAASAESWPVVRVEPQDGSPDPEQDVFLDLAVGLEALGMSHLSEELDKGTDANLGGTLLRTLRSKRVLIIVDEFQRLFPKDHAAPSKQWQWVVPSFRQVA